MPGMPLEVINPNSNQLVTKLVSALRKREDEDVTVFSYNEIRSFDPVHDVLDSHGSRSRSLRRNHDGKRNENLRVVLCYCTRDAISCKMLAR